MSKNNPPETKTLPDPDESIESSAEKIKTAAKEARKTARKN